MKVAPEKNSRIKKSVVDNQDMGIKPSWMSDEDMIKAIAEARSEPGEKITREEMKKSIRS